jgi:phosphoribosylformylglycinamidine synthase
VAGLVPAIGVLILDPNRGLIPARAATAAPSFERPARQVSMMKARVTVTLKTGILDPQGKAIEGALKSLGVGGVASVRQGKVFEIELDGTDRAQAEEALKDAAERLLANTVVENYRIEVVG